MPGASKRPHGSGRSALHQRNTHQDDETSQHGDRADRLVEPQGRCGQGDQRLEVQEHRHLSCLEVLEGLRPNDWIVTSSYTTFNDVDELEFTEPIPFPDSMTADAAGVP